MDTRPHWPYPTKLTISLLLLALFIYLLTRFSIAIPPFIIAVIVAYVLTPTVNFFQARLKLPRVLAILVAYLLALLILAALPSVIVPMIASQFTELNVDLQLILTQVQRLLGREYRLAGMTIDTTQLLDQLSSGLQGLLEPIVGQTFKLLVEMISSIVWIIFVIIVSFYLIKDGKKLGEWFEAHVPPQYLPDYVWLRGEINQIWSAFFRGQLLLGLVVALIFIAIGFLLGLPFALAMGILAGLLEFLPSIGHGIWMTIAALLALFLGSTWIPLPNWAFMLIIIGLHMFFQQFDLNYLIPRIIGRSVHLPPLVVILGIVAGAVLAGILGIPLAAPTIASARVIGRYIFANLFDLAWAPVSFSLPLPSPNPRWWQRNIRKEEKS